MGILTTVVGSYPVPDWLVALPSEQALLDAMAVILKTQENAGIDVIADGEPGRFDINHPETNGMIEYFVKPLGNVRADITRTDVAAFRKDPGMALRVRDAAGHVELPSTRTWIPGIHSRRKRGREDNVDRITGLSRVGDRTKLGIELVGATR